MKHARSKGNPKKRPPTVIPQEKHAISLKRINKNALAVLSHLHQAGHQAYLVGGGVRDLLLDIVPKDFDIATNARPEEIRKLFRNSRIIGKRFRLVHVFFGKDIVEVATFRTHHPEDGHPEAHLSDVGVVLRDNIYGTLEDDAWRRDFSVNALYYDISTLSVLDYTGGMHDITKRSIRVLGDPVARYNEDPVRMLRAIRLAAKLNFSLEENAGQAIMTCADFIAHASPARLFDEVVKLFYCGHAVEAFELLKQYQLLNKLFPASNDVLLKHDKQQRFAALIQQSCKNTDSRIRQHLSLNPAFLFAVLLWGPLQQKIKVFKTEGHKPYQAMQMAIRRVLHEQQKHIAIPKRFAVIIQEIWGAQHPLERHDAKRANMVFSRPRFRAAYDFLALRYQSGETELKKAVDWWSEYQKTHPHKIVSRHPLTVFDEDDHLNS